MLHQQTDNPLSSLLNEKLNHFKLLFLESSRQLFANNEGKLIHPGEFGTYRETICKEFLTSFIPQRMTIDSGFLINSDGKISTQCDLVIYDKSVTPLLQNENRQRFFPIESVCAVGEIKSVMSLNDLKEALLKLSNHKSLRDTLYEPQYFYKMKDDEKFQPEVEEKDQIITFLICESFSFNIHDKLGEVLNCYNKQLPHRPFCHKHNLILSLNDGLITYIHPDGYLYQFPSKSTTVLNCNNTDTIQNIYVKANILNHRVIQPLNEDSLEHIRLFCTLIHQGLTAISVFFPDMGRYIISQEEVLFYDIEQER
jgi:hypothetical protein